MLLRFEGHPEVDDEVSIPLLLIFQGTLSNIYQSLISTINWCYRTHAAKQHGWRNMFLILFDNDDDIVDADDDDVTYHADTIVAIFFHLILKKGWGHGSYSIIYDLCDHK